MSGFANFKTTALRSKDVATLLGKLFGRIEAGDERQRRLQAIVQGVVTSFGSRLVALVVSFASVPLTIGYLGPERYGAWVTIGSLLAWLGLSDLGLGKGLLNAINTAVGEERTDIVRTHVSNAIFFLSLPAIALAAAAYFFAPLVDWSSFLGLTSAQAKAEIGPAIEAAVVIFVIQIPLSMTERVYMAFHEGRIANYWSAAGNILTLLALLVVTQTRGGLPWLVVAVSGTSLLLNFANTLWLYLVHQPQVAPSWRYLDFAEMRSVAPVGWQFFLLQILALIVFETDNIFVGHFLGAARIAQYSLTYMLFGYTSLPQSLAYNYMWTTYTQAIASRDIDWLKRALRFNVIGGTLITGVAVAFLAVEAKPILTWWGGPAATPTTELVAWMAAWAILSQLMNSLACLLAAASHIAAQIKYSAAAAVVNMALSYFLVQYWGVHGVIAATVISYAIFISAPCIYDIGSLLRKLERGA